MNSSKLNTLKNSKEGPHTVRRNKRKEESS